VLLLVRRHDTGGLVTLGTWPDPTLEVPADETAGKPADGVPPLASRPNPMLTQNQVILDALSFWENHGGGQSMSAWAKEHIAAVRAAICAAPLQPLPGMGPIRIAVTLTEEEYIKLRGLPPKETP
jgi:hypothetical protein